MFCNIALRPAFNVAILFWFICGAMLSAVALTVVDDERAVQDHVKRCLTVAMEQPASTFASIPQEDSDERATEAAPPASVPNPLHQIPYQSQTVVVLEPKTVL
jgi:hypothetical protein